VTAQRLVCGLGLVKICSEEESSDESAVGEAGSTQVGIGCRLEALAVEVLTALGERDQSGTRCCAPAARCWR
jgi:hypothetical protein